MTRAAAIAAFVAVTLAAPTVWAEPPSPTEYDPGSGVPPGGYWGPGEAPEIAPKDGEDQILAGSIAAAIGGLTTASAAVSLYLTMPGHCERRMQWIGANPDAEQCEGLLILNAIRVGYGAAGVITGAVLLAVGFRRRKEYKLWKKRRFQSATRWAPQLNPQRRGLSAGLVLRF